MTLTNYMRCKYEISNSTHSRNEIKDHETCSVLIIYVHGWKKNMYEIINPYYKEEKQGHRVLNNLKFWSSIILALTLNVD